MTDAADRIAKLSPEKRALLMQRLKQKGDGAQTPALTRRPNPDEYPLSFAQQRLWFLDQLEPGSPFYNIAAALRLSGPLDVAALQRALAEVARRHEVLRARFITEQGYPVQVIAPELALPLTVTDLQDRPAAEREAEALRLADEEARRPFDLAHGPLVRAGLVRIDATTHLLLLTLHHIVSDGWSVQVLVQELAALYTAHARGAAAADLLPPLPVQYADFAHWQREQLAGGLRETQLAYWKQQLADLPVALDLPTDRPRPLVQSYRGARHVVALPAALAEQLRALSRQESATLFMTLLAAYQVLLARYSGQDDLAVGIPVANRTRPEVQGLVGFFVNTLVMRARLGGEAGSSFRALLGQVREAVLGGQAHQDLPFELLLDALDVQRDMSRSPLFQVMFALQESPLDGVQLGDLRLGVVAPDTGTAKFDLTLFIDENPDGLSATFEYNTDLFEAATIARLGTHFLTLLAGLAADPDRALSALPLLGEAERRQILVDWNATAADFPGDVPLPELFAAQVAHRPDAMAVRFGEAALTYRELDARANQLAHWLQRQGVGPNQLVGLFAERSLDLIVAILAIIKAGGAYLPLDIEYPRDRLAFMLADGGVRVLLTQARLQAELPAGPATVLCLDSEWPAVAGEPASAPAQAATAESLAYVIYTSGSTGQPKGVAVPQRAITRLVFNTNYITLGPDDRIAQVSNASFDAATFEIWGALLHGGQLVGVPKDVALAPRQFAELIQTEGLTAMFLTTALFNHLAASVPGIFRPLRTLMLGGEAADPRWVRHVLATGAPERLLNAYGPTETTTFATWYDTRDLRPDAASVPIGRPIGNTTAYILDRALQPVPVGVHGELCLGGPGVALGYLNRPELTAEKFVTLALADAGPGAKDDRGQAAAGPVSSVQRLYRTGDRVRWLPDGTIDFVGRFDHQVKIRGFRIELGEIEAVLGQHPGVRELLVVVRDDGGDKRVVAYLVPQPGQAPTLAELRAYLRERLPEYMVPSAFILLDQFPLNPNGKVDRRALPAPDQAQAASGRPFLAPRTPAEQFLAGLWKEVLRLERVSVYDNFFEVGGDSIKAAVLTNRMQESLQVTAPVRALFMAPTIAELGMYLAEYYPDAVRHLGEAAPALLADEQPAPPPAEVTRRLGADDVMRLRQAIPPLAPRAAAPARQNPPAVFLLSPPRSGSTLLRVMLDGHLRLFAPPEMDLLSFNTLAERRAAFSGESAFWLQGPVRALMAARELDADAADRLMEAFERRGLTVQEFYAELQSCIGGRLLVDKTPTYPLDLNILRRAEEDFAGARYIHLVRHPYSSIYSFVEAKLDQVFFRHPHTFSRRELAELVWTLSHQNILTFLQDVPAERQVRVHFEELVGDPEAVTRRLCDFLKIDFDPALVRPYEGERMTDGVRPGAQMVGDFKFYLRKDIDANAADRWRRFHTSDFLGDVGLDLAERLGYGRVSTTTAPASAAAAPLGELRPVPRDGDLPLSFAQQRLWFLDQLEPASPYYNVPAAVRFSGALDVAVLERSLNEIIRRHEALRVTFESVDGRPVVRALPELAVRLQRVDVSDRPRPEREAEAQRLARAEALRPFDLARGPLIRGSLFRLAPDEHLFLLVMHHVICDGWSVGVLTREVAALYTAFSQGLASPLPPLPLQYADFAYWQRQWLQGPALQAQLDYWKRQLADAPAQLDLPTDRPRPALQTYRGARYTFALNPQLSRQLNEFSRAQGVTLFATLMAGFQTLLHRYTGQADVCTGTPIANRTRAEIEGLIGFFVNTLVLRTDFSGDPTFPQLLQRVAATAVEAFDRQDVPFEMVVDAVRPARDLSRTPLFQVMFALQNTPTEAVRLPGLTFAPAHVDGGTSKFDMTVFLQEREGELRGLVEYNTDLFDAATIARLMGHFRVLLGGLVADPERPVSALPLLPDDERALVLDVWNRTAQPHALDDTVPARIAAQAARTPTHTAVLCEDSALTYAELDAQANQLAHALRARGVGPDTLAGLCLERSPALIVGVLAIWKAGGAYLPLDPAYPPERLEYMLQDSGAAVLVTTTALADRLGLAAPGRQLLCLDSDQAALAAQPATEPVSTAGPANLAYVIYTSGSTGRPKGALIEHRSALNLGETLQRVIYAPLGVGLRLSLNAPLSFDASIQHLLLLMFGHTLCVVPQDVRLDGAALLAWLRRVRLDGLDCVPSQLKLLIEAGLFDGAGWAPRALLPGGEAIDAALWQTLAQAPATQTYNVYGPTECTCDVTIGPVKARPDRPVIGRPVDNTQLYVLDTRGQPVPVGVAGELHIGGVQVGRGYLNRPDLTAEKFVALSLGEGRPAAAGGPASPDVRVYKTGDLVRYLPDGNLEFLGRLDDQVKVRGFRIELGEIAAALKEHPALRDAVVVAREDAPGVKRLVAYLVRAAEAGPLPAGELREFLKQRLPDYMLPAAFVTLERLPLTPSGKIDRRALPAPDQERPELESAYVGPRTPAEATLTAIWAQVLGVQQVGVRDNFFELGGDSILSIQIIARANQAGLRLTPRQFFQQPTIEGLAAVAGQGPVIQAEQGPVTGPVPLTPIQRHFFRQALPAPHHWNQAFLLEVRERLDPDALRGAIAALLRHHDALRLRYTPTDSGWAGVIAAPDEAVPFHLEDLSAVPDDALAAAIEARCAAAQASLDLAAGPLLQAVSFDCGPGRPDRLLLVIHHLAIDGVSWRVLFEDLQTAYTQLRQGRAAALPAKTTSFRAWAERLAAHADAEATRAELDYWQAQGAPAPLPLDHADGQNTEASAEGVRVELSEAETTALLQDVPAAYGTEINDALLTALAQALTAWTGGTAAWVTLEGHGREDLFEDVDVSRTVGWFTTLYPVRLDLGRRDLDPGAALKTVKEQLRAIPRRGLGFGLLRELRGALPPESPLPGISFNYLGQFDQLLGDAARFAPAREGAGPSRSLDAPRGDLVTVTGSLARGRLQVEWLFSRNLHRRETLARLAEGFLQALRALVAHCQTAGAVGYTPSDFPEADLGDQDLEALMGEFGETI
mgnify:CR=1 FL=1